MKVRFLFFFSARAWALGQEGRKGWRRAKVRWFPASPWLVRFPAPLEKNLGNLTSLWPTGLAKTRVYQGQKTSSSSSTTKISEIIYAFQGCCKGAVLNVSVFQLSECLKVGLEAMASKSCGARLAWFLAFGPPNLIDSWLCAFGTQPVYHTNVSVMRLSAMHISMMHNKTNRRTTFSLTRICSMGPAYSSSWYYYHCLGTCDM